MNIVAVGRPRGRFVASVIVSTFAGVLLSSCAGGENKEVEGLSSSRQAVAQQQGSALSATQASISIIGPARGGPLQALVLSSNSLTIRSRVEVQDAQQKRAPVANTGTGATFVQPDTTLRSVFAFGSLELRDRVSIEKDAISATLVEGNDDTIGGKIKVPQPSDLSETLS